MYRGPSRLITSSSVLSIPASFLPCFVTNSRTVLASHFPEAPHEVCHTLIIRLTHMPLLAFKPSLESLGIQEHGRSGCAQPCAVYPSCTLFTSFSLCHSSSHHVCHSLSKVAPLTCQNECARPTAQCCPHQPLPLFLVACHPSSHHAHHSLSKCLTHRPK